MFVYYEWDKLLFGQLLVPLINGFLLNCVSESSDHWQHVIIFVCCIDCFVYKWNIKIVTMQEWLASMGPFSKVALLKICFVADLFKSKVRLGYKYYQGKSRERYSSPTRPAASSSASPPYHTLALPKTLYWKGNPISWKE